MNKITRQRKTELIMNGKEASVSSETEVLTIVLESGFVGSPEPGGDNGEQER